MRTRGTVLGIAVAGLLCVLFLGVSPSPKAKSKKTQIDRGHYLVTICLCNDCHSPKIFTKNGPIPDSTRLLSGQPAADKVPEIPKGVLAPDQWAALGNSHFTAWGGPWGVSFARNLTPDTATGLGSWTEDIFIKALRTGKDMGEGRAILPPMPWDFIGQMTDADLKAVFAYLQSLPPIDNAVPDPISPTGEKMPTLKKPKQ
jgi:hypothetical protein